MKYPQSYALVLSGGGAKGSYQIGAMRALKELKIHINAVVGTSVGALNGALWIMGMVNEAEEMWRDMTLRDVIDIPEELLSDGKFHLHNGNRNVFNDLARRIGRKGGMSTAPLRGLMRDLLDEEKIRKSGVDFGVVSYQVGGMKALEKFLEQIPQGQLEDHLMGSAAFPGFEIQRIEGQMVLDGGLSDNIPFSLASRRGYRNIIILDISGLGVNRRPQFEHHNIIYIKNSRDTGGVMDFQPEQAETNLRMGYLDTMKMFGVLEGIDLFLKPDHRIEKKLLKALHKEEHLEKYGQYLLPMEKGEKTLETRIRKVLPPWTRNHKSLVLALLETTVRCFHIDTLQLYTWKEILEKVCDSYKRIREKRKALDNNRGFLDRLTKILKEVQHFKDLDPIEYGQLMDFIFGSAKARDLHTRALVTFMPELVGARIFLSVLDCLLARSH